MSRSVSAPSSVTNTSPCWNGLIVPGSTFRYGSNFCTCTLRPRAFSSRPSEAAVMPLPSDETTPPVTKTYFVRHAGASRESRLHPPRRVGPRTSERASDQVVEPASAMARRLSTGDLGRSRERPGRDGAAMRRSTAVSSNDQRRSLDRGDRRVGRWRRRGSGAAHGDPYLPARLSKPRRSAHADVRPPVERW